MLLMPLLTLASRTALKCLVTLGMNDRLNANA
jgi:hypothetical protein